ncbi:protein of unknown function [Paraburkholderia kururiensis]
MVRDQIPIASNRFEHGVKLRVAVHFLEALGTLKTDSII